MAGFILSKDKPKPRERKQAVALVDVQSLAPVDRPVTIRAQGLVAPARQLTITPQVSGRLAELHTQMVAGGRVAKGARLFRIESREYVLAVRQQEAQVAQAEFTLALEHGRKDVAEREWETLEEGRTGERDAAAESLARREPHLKAAQAGLDAARAALDRARLNVERTSVRAPFDALVVSEDIEVGQVVGPQTRAATLVAVDTYWVEVALQAADLAAIEIPGAPAVISRRQGREVVRRTGKVIRALGAVERAGRLARLIIEIDAPLVTGTGPGDPRLPLLLDDYVEVAIEGRQLTGVYEVPRTALYEGDRVYLMGKDDTLIIRDVQVAWRDRDVVHVSAGLEPGDRLIVSPLATPAPGIPLRTGAGAGEPPAPKAQR
jgi:RND family efflux transporter MFP subunit